jgi:cobalt-zinc-cadmium efflux system membrane fusion protein
VQVGQRTQDGQWVEITQGLTAGQSYVAEGSFLLKSELEKESCAWTLIPLKA